MNELISYLKAEIERINGLLEDPVEDHYYYYGHGEIEAYRQVLSKLDDINKEEEDR